MNFTPAKVSATASLQQLDYLAAVVALRSPGAGKDGASTACRPTTFKRCVHSFCRSSPRRRARRHPRTTSRLEAARLGGPHSRVGHCDGRNGFSTKRATLPRAPLLPEPARDAAPLASPRHGVLHAQRGREAADRQTEQRGAPEVLRRRRDDPGRRRAAPEALEEFDLGRGPGGGAAGPV